MCCFLYDPVKAAAHLGMDSFHSTNARGCNQWWTHWPLLRVSSYMTHQWIKSQHDDFFWWQYDLITYTFPSFCLFFLFFPSFPNRDHDGADHDDTEYNCQEVTSKGFLCDSNGPFCFSLLYFCVCCLDGIWHLTLLYQQQKRGQRKRKEDKI